MQFVQFDEHLTPIGGGNEEKIDSRAIRPSTSCRINSINSKFFLQDLHGAIDVGTAIFHLLDALSKFCQIFCDGPGAAGLARGQNVQGNSLGKMKLKFLGILIRWHIGESGRAIGNSDSPKRIALHRESNRDGGIGSKEQCGEFALGPPDRNGRSCGRPTQPVDFTRGRIPF